VTTPMPRVPFSSPEPAPLKKKRVLLVDASPTKRDLRAETMRKLGMDVDCAADINEARSWWRADRYNLVLINLENELGHRDKFCEDLRGAAPPQQLAFLVGKPEYLSHSPNMDGAPSVQEEDGPVLCGDVKAALSADILGGLPQSWGILEACRRISAVRSISDARSKAVRQRPAPPRDLETRYCKHPEAESQVLRELQKDEMYEEPLRW
jgi:CheY-like chemotaxis protein